MIIARYITKEVMWTFLGITGILVLIALSNRFAQYLAKAATGELPIGFVFRLVGLYTPELLSLLIPLSFFMAILFAYGRLHSDSEMTVLSACGIGWKYISKVTLVMASFVMILVALLTLWWVPTLTAVREQVMSEGEALGVITTLLPGRFQSFADGGIVFYLEDVTAKKNSLKGVFIAEHPHSDKNMHKDALALLTAEGARIESDPNSKAFYLVLDKGYRYHGKPGSANYTMIKFDEYGRSVIAKADNTSNDPLKLKSSGNLWGSSDREDKGELQWRLSIPLSVPILALLAIPLAAVKLRQGRVAKFLPAIVLYLLYYNLFAVSKRWVATGVLPSFIGVYWVHALFLLLALGLIAKESGWFWAFYNRRDKSLSS